MTSAHGARRGATGKLAGALFAALWLVGTFACSPAPITAYLRRVGRGGAAATLVLAAGSVSAGMQMVIGGLSMLAAVTALVEVLAVFPFVGRFLEFGWLLVTTVMIAAGRSVSLAAPAHT